MIKKPIFIIGVHKSGTTLVRSLLDGHPNLFVIPIETHIFKFNGHWVDYPYRSNFPENKSVKKIKEEYLGWIKKTNNLPANFKGGEVPTDWNLRLIKSYFDQYGRFTSLKESITSYFEAMAYSMGADKKKRFVEKSVENAEFAIDLKNLFPDAKFIHILRNPYANIVSIRNFSIGNHYPYIKTIYKALYNNYYFLYKNRNIITDYKIVRYEDLVKKTKLQMDKIADFLNIPHAKILYKPTNKGKIWPGNSSDNKKYNSVSTRRLSNWKNEITPLECKLINNKFPFILRDYNYNKFVKKSYWKKNKKETIKNYLKNRIFIRNV